MASINVYGEAKQTVVQTRDNTLFAANDFGIIKVVDLNHKDNEPEILEVNDELTNFLLNKNIIVSTSQSGNLDLYQIDGRFANVTATSTCFSSALPLRDVQFIDDAHVVCAGDDTELVTVDISTVVTGTEYRVDGSAVFEALSKTVISDQARSLSYNQELQILAVSLASGNVVFMKRNGMDFNIERTLSDAFGKHVFGFDPEDVDNLVKGKISWSGSSFAVGNKTNDIEIFKWPSLQSQKTLSGVHSGPVIDTAFCSYNAQYIASIDYSNRLAVWDVEMGRSVRTKTFPGSFKLKNICWTSYDGVVVVIVGTTSGDVFEDKLEFIDVQSAKRGNADITTTVGDISAPDFMEDDDDLFDDNNTSFAQPAFKRTRPDFDSDVESDSDGPQFTSAIPKYSLKPYGCGCTAWNGETRYLVANQYGTVIAQRKPGENFQTITITPSDSPSYYITDSRGFDLACLDQEAVVLGCSGYIEECDTFSTSLTSLKDYKQAVIHYRPHRSADDGWFKTLPMKNHHKKASDNSKSRKKVKTNEFMTTLCLSRKNIFVYSSLGHTRTLSKYGLVTRLEKTLPVACAASNGKIVFTISTDGRSSYYSVRDLVSSNKHKYIQRDSLLPIDYIRQDLMEDEANFDSVLARFDTFEDKALDNNQLDASTVASLVFSPPDFLVKGIFFSYLGDPCLVDNNDCVYVVSRWRISGAATVIPLLSLRSLLINKALEYIPLSFEDHSVWATFYARGTLPNPLPEPTEIPIKIPLSLDVDVRALKESKLKDDFIEDEEMESEESEHEISEENQKEIDAEEEVLRSKMVAEMLNEAVDTQDFFEKSATKKFKAFKRAQDQASTDTYIQELDLDLSDFERDDEILTIRRPLDINSTIEKLENLNKVYDRSLLQMFSQLCSSGELAKAGSLIKDLKQDRALIAAGRIAERLELDQLVELVGKEREIREN